MDAAARPQAHPTRAIVLAVVAAWLLVALRSAVFVYYEHAFFDSDQAIIGLMAKHLAEGRAFPLFYYGQTYMMGVDAWVAALVFLVAGPTVAALHAAIVLVNLAVVALFLWTCSRSMGLSPWPALVASLFFTFAPPFTSANLIEAGANIGPFVYVILLWLTRDRPLWFGAILAFGFENREFTIYAVPALGLVQLCQGTFFRMATLRNWLLAFVAFCAMWQGIEALKPFADLMGPGTRGQLLHGSAGSQIDNIANRIAPEPREWPHRLWVMMHDDIPRLAGASFVDEGLGAQGRDWMRWPFLGALLLAGVRGLWLTWRGGRREGSASPAFGWYLAAIGVLAALGYVATRPAVGIVDRYLLLTLFIPIGVVAVLFALEPRRLARVAATIVLGAWASVSALDHAELFRHYHSGADPNVLRVVADSLVARGVHVAQAGYWRAYKLAFLTREQVKIASTDVIRIDEYQDLANREGDRLMTLQDDPCPGGERVGVMFLCRRGS